MKIMNVFSVKYYKSFLLFLCSWFIGITVYGQELEPNLLSSMPIGGNVAVASYGFSSGNIMLDNTVPIEDLESKLNAVVFAYARSLRLFNKLTKIDAVIPFAIANYTGLLESVEKSARKQGLGDPSFRISMILIGEQALSPGEFFGREKKKFKLGTTARIQVPLGQYDSAKLINLSTNRFTFKLGLAGSYAIAKKVNWEVHFNSFIFTANNAFNNGNTLEQKPLITLQSHLSYEFKPGVWVAVSYGKSSLGETLLNGVEKDDIHKNTRSGVAFAYRLGKSHSLKAIATTGVTTRYGADFTTFALAYQYLWFDKR